MTEDGSPRGRDRVRAVGAAGDLGPRRARRAAAPRRRSPRWPSCSATSCSTTPRPWRSSARGAPPRRVAAAVRERLGRTRPDLAARVAAYRGGYLRGGAARPRARAARPPAARAGVDERARARRGHRRARRRPAGRLPGQPRVGLAAGRAGRSGRRAGTRGAGRAGRPAGQLPRASPRGAVRHAGRGDRVRPGQPVRARAAPRRGGGRAAAAGAPISSCSARPRPARSRALTEAGLLRRRPTGWFWTSRDRATDLADLRGSGGGTVRVVEARTGRMLGTVDAASAHRSRARGCGVRPPGRHVPRPERSTSTTRRRWWSRPSRTT